MLQPPLFSLGFPVDTTTSLPWSALHLMASLGKSSRLRLPGNGFSVFPCWWCISMESPCLWASAPKHVRFPHDALQALLLSKASIEIKFELGVLPLVYLMLLQWVVEMLLPTLLPSFLAGQAGNCPHLLFLTLWLDISISGVFLLGETLQTLHEQLAFARFSLCFLLQSEDTGLLLAAVFPPASPRHGHWWKMGTSWSLTYDCGAVRAAFDRSR